MHLHTIVKVKAKDAAEACDIVAGILEEADYNGCPFDYYNNDATQVCHEITEADFQALRENELAEYEQQLEKALALPNDHHLKGFYLRMAGESLEDDNLWSACRLAYDYAKQYQDDEDGDVFFVTTDTHY